MKSINSIKIRLMAALCAVVLLASCKDNGTSVISKPQTQIGQTITKDTLSGSVKGTMISGHTYYFLTDLTINHGDTLLMQSGSQLISLWTPGMASASPQITASGTFISLGTQALPNYIGPLPSQRTPANLFLGLWGGIQGDTGSGDMIIKWTHLEYAGGPAGANADPSLYAAGDPRYMIEYRDPYANFILEDSWLHGTTDDCVRTNGGMVSIMRNTFEAEGLVGGEEFNIKNATVGDVAYNLFIGSCTNGAKIANTKGSNIQCNAHVFNNTFVNCGWRQTEAGRSGSTDIEKGGKGMEYNNLYVNCRTGFRLLSGADSVNCAYGYQYYYGQTQSIVNEFYPPDGIQAKGTGDIAGAPLANDPMFVNYDVNQFDYSMLSPTGGAIDISNQPLASIQQGTFDFHLKPTSPAIGKGTTTAFQPLGSVTRLGGDFGANPTLPGKDMGAYQTDGTGNLH